jgi:hypothetical protein
MYPQTLQRHTGSGSDKVIPGRAGIISLARIFFLSSSGGLRSGIDLTFLWPFTMASDT